VSDLNEEALEYWMRANIPSFEGIAHVEKFSGGQSNPTYLIRSAARSYALRRKPFGQLLRGAHAIEREARVISALNSAGFPVPHVYGVCTDDRVIGAWFYVMEMVQGRIFWDSTFPEVQRSERPLYFDAMNQTLARLHSIDPSRVGLDDFGSKSGYLARQIARWSKQYTEDIDAGRDPNMDRMIEWLPQHIPQADESCIVHGDFRCDNMIFHPTEPKVVAVLDWELSTLGHPLADFAYHLMMYRVPPLLGADLRGLNIPSESEYTETYCARTGRNGVPNMDFYLAFNLFRFAAILHGIRGRAIRGNATSANYKDLAAAMPEMARRAWELAARSSV
jgi:aminoglycoside phosphotransferase (APT) family kinase protein